MKIGFVFCSNPESGMVYHDVLLSGPPLYLSASPQRIYLHSARAKGGSQNVVDKFMYVCAEVLNKNQLMENTHSGNQ